ncbi:putative macrophage mannose receptor 1 [Rosellinia necatrix]|uniref:Putative macrophage mannose receptor 1 n=1 Tax=Rosellinia necatrix TaxID=77044 RepID=A0A1W2TMB0_ROSNE|nr:putative macrophage mannose receptor 1 [Rosellinia necatrix]
MAPSLPEARGRGRVTTPRPSIEATTNDAHSLSKGKSQSSDINTSLRDSTQIPAQQAPVPKYYVYVLGKEMMIPQTYDPDTYDPEGRMPGTPEPELYDPETYTAWGKKHFGDEWYELRERMMRERNIELKRYDDVYMERQRALRIMEHEIERRPFEPDSGWMHDKGWKRLWPRIAIKLGIEITSNQVSPAPEKGSDESDTDLSGFSTYPPTPEPRPPTPLPEDPWERLEYLRKDLAYEEEEYHFHRIFLKERLKDIARSEYENEDGDRRIQEKEEKMEYFRCMDPGRFYIEQRRLEAYTNWPKVGWTRKEIDGYHDAFVGLHEWRKDHPEPKDSSPSGYVFTDEEMAIRRDAWRQEFDANFACIFGEARPKYLVCLRELKTTVEESSSEDLWYKNTHGRISRQQQRQALLDGAGDPSSLVESLQRIENEERRDREVIERAVEKEEEARLHLPPVIPFPNSNWVQERAEERPTKLTEAALRSLNKSSFKGSPSETSETSSPQPTPSLRSAEDTSRKVRSGRVAKAAPNHSNAPSRNRSLRTVKPGISEELGSNAAAAPQDPHRQRKVYTKERMSRRLAGQSPEYGMLPARGEPEPPRQWAPPRPSNTRQLGNKGRYGDKPSKKPATARSAKSQAVSKPTQARAPRLKNLVGEPKR